MQIGSHGRSLVALLRLLHQGDTTTRWTAALAPWLIAQGPRDAVVGWTSPLLAGCHHPTLDPFSTIGMFCLGQDCISVVMFADGTLAGMAGQPTNADLTSLQQAMLTGRAMPTIIEQLARAERVVIVGVLDRDAGPTATDGELDAPIPLTLARPTIDHLCAHIVSVDPTFNAAEALVGHPGIGLDALRHLDDTSADALFGSPSARARVAAGGSASTPPPPPDPFADQANWRSWLGAAVTMSPYPVSRLLADVHRHRVDLHETYPDLTQVRHRLGLLRWAAEFAAEDDPTLPSWAIPRSDLLPRVDPASQVQPRRQGTTVIGYLDSALGLGEAARIMVRNLRLAGDDVSTRTYRHITSPAVPWREVQPDVSHDIDLICLNGAELERWNRSAPIGFHNGAYRIGLWFWETDRLTPEMASGVEFVDEIWVTSEYTAASIRGSIGSSRVPIRAVPLGCQLDTATPVDAAAARRRVAALLGPGVSLTARWAGFAFDMASRIDRKNPLGLIDAWVLAFPEAAPTRQLIIKTMNGAAHRNEFDLLVARVVDRSDITLVDATWTTSQQHDFISALDVYVSLHRSEGYGLLLLEALAVGTPVVATGATGNLAFMNDDNSWLVPAPATVLTTDAGPYRTGGVVYEPNLETAAELLASVLGSEPSITTAKIARGKADTLGLVDGTTGATWLRRRLAEIRRGRS